MYSGFVVLSPSHHIGMVFLVLSYFGAVKILTVCGFPSIFHAFFIIFPVFP